MLEALRRVPDLFNHRLADVRNPHDIRVANVAQLSLRRAHLPLLARLVELNLLAHNDRLDADQHLQNCGHVWVPVFVGRAPPGAQQREADLAVGLEVWVESYLSVAGGRQGALGGDLGVLVRAEDVLNEGPVGLGGVRRPEYKRAHHVHARCVVSNEDSVGGLAGQRIGQV